MACLSMRALILTSRGTPRPEGCSGSFRAAFWSILRDAILKGSLLRMRAEDACSIRATQQRNMVREGIRPRLRTLSQPVEGRDEGGREGLDSWRHLWRFRSEQRVNMNLVPACRTPPLRPCPICAAAWRRRPCAPVPPRPGGSGSACRRSTPFCRAGCSGRPCTRSTPRARPISPPRPALPSVWRCARRRAPAGLLNARSCGRGRISSMPRPAGCTRRG